MEFCLKRNTVCVNIVDPTKDYELIKQVVFFGDIPAEVRRIINSRKFKENEKTLSDYFGKKWKEKLRISNKGNRVASVDPENIYTARMAQEDEDGMQSAERIGKTVHQGRAQRNATLGGFDFDLENVSDVKLEENNDVVQVVDYDEKVTYITNIILFPEDTFWTLKEKLYLAIGIPIYRQYVYQHLLEDDPAIHKTIQSIFIADSPYNISTRDDTEKFNGILIDKNVYNNRENLRIKTKETYKMIDSMMIDDFYLVDLQFYRNVLINVESILESNYTSDVLYFGLFKKYFPIFDKEMMIRYFTDEKQILNGYPLINNSLTSIEQKYETESVILKDIYNNIDKYYDKYADDIELAISKICYKLLDNYAVSGGLFIRNIIDIFKCSEKYPFIECYITKNNVKYRIVKYFKNQSEDSIKKFIEDKTYKVIDEITIYFWDEKFKQLNNFTLNANSIYTACLTYLKSDSIDFSDSLENTKLYVNEIISEINANKKLIFNPNFSLAEIPLLDKETTVVNSVIVNVKWNRIITPQQFAHVNDILQEFYKSGIAEHRVLSTITPNVINIRMKKGINQHVNKFFLKKGVEVKNYFIIFHDLKSNDIWNMRYGGRNINIENNLTNVTFEFLNIVDKEFVRVINYVMYIINRVDQLGNKTASSDTVTKKRSAMKKMKEVDPKLYNFSVPGSLKPVKYSRICQKKFRPINIYIEEEYKQLPIDHQKKLFQFINYTTGEPVWYECPSSLPYLGFIPNKHPSGFCIPKCKAAETKGTKNLSIRDSCMKKYSFNTKSEPTGMLKFGKILEVGKTGYLHEKIYQLIESVTGNIEPHFFMKNVSPSFFGVPGSRIICCFAEQSGLSEQEILQKFIEYSKNDSGLLDILNSMAKGDANVVNDMSHTFISLLKEIFGVNIVYINTVVNVHNEILNSQNSSVFISMENSCSSYILRNQNIKMVVLIRLYDQIYPVVDNDGKGIFNNESEFVQVLYKAMQDKLLRIEKEITNKEFTYTVLKDKIGKYVKYVANGKIKYLVTKDLCIGVSNSANIVDVEEVHDVFVRKDHNLPFAALASFLEKEKINVKPIILTIQPSTSCGLQIDDIYCWFNDTSLAKVQKQFPNSRIRMLVCEPSDVNKAIVRRLAPKREYLNGISDTYYNIYIYKLLKYEVFKNILLYRDLAMRKTLLREMGNRSFLDMITRIKNINRNDYYKILNIINNSSNPKDDLNRILLNHDIEKITDEISSKMRKDVIALVNSILKQISISTESVTGQVENLIVSHIEYDKHDNIIQTKHKEDLFYRNNKLKILRDKLDIYKENLVEDMQNKLLFIYEINNFNIFFIINYFHFISDARTKIHVQLL